MVVIGLVVAVLAAALHGYIFVMESLAWTTPRVRALFGTSEEEAQATRQLAFNQGFYNLFLAVIVVAGAVLLAVGSVPAGTALLIAGLGSMLLAAVVLLLGSREHRSAALRQGALPLFALLLLCLGALL